MHQLYFAEGDTNIHLIRDNSIKYVYTIQCNKVQDNAIHTTVLYTTDCSILPILEKRETHSHDFCVQYILHSVHNTCQ